MTLITMAGLPGTGKTALAKALIETMVANDNQADQENAQIIPTMLNKDTIRAALFPPALIEYSHEQDDFCIDILLRVAAYLFHKSPHRTIVLDGRTFSRRDQVSTIEKAALDMGVSLYWIECVCDPETAKQRLMNDKGKRRHPADNRDPSLYDKVKAYAEPLKVQRLTVDTTQPLQNCITDVLRYLSRTPCTQNTKDKCAD